MKKSVFPNTIEVASYSYISQTIVFNDITRDSLDRCIKSPFDHKNISNYKTVTHEITHYLDNIATLVGNKILIQSINALNVISCDSLDEKEFWRFITLRNTIRKTTFDNYYKKINVKVQTTTRPEDWKYRNTLGCRFDIDGQIDELKPIIFCNFVCNGKDVARIPFSVEALFEINAMANEVYLHNRYLFSHGEDFQTVEKNTFLKSTYDWVYNKELLTYSVAAHIVAPIVETGELVEIFMLAKTISTMSLNLPSTLYQNLKVPEYFQAISIERLRGFIENYDPNFAFVCLVQNYIESGISFTEFNNTTLIDDLLSASNLPPLEVIGLMVSQEMNEISGGVSEGNYTEMYNNHMELSESILEERGIYGYFDEKFFSKFNLNYFLIICEDEVCDQNVPVTHHDRVAVMKNIY